MNRSASFFAVSAAVLGISGSVLFSADAVAASPAPLPAKVVRYNDLNLAASRDVATLYARLQTAAADVCGNEYRPGDKFVYTAWQVCVATAVDAGVRKVDRPELTAYHAARIAAPSLIRVASRG